MQQQQGGGQPAAPPPPPPQQPAGNAAGLPPAFGVGGFAAPAGYGMLQPDSSMLFSLPTMNSDLPSFMSPDWLQSSLAAEAADGGAGALPPAILQHQQAAAAAAAAAAASLPAMQLPMMQPGMAGNGGMAGLGQQPGWAGFGAGGGAAPMVMMPVAPPFPSGAGQPAGGAAAAGAARGGAPPAGAAPAQEGQGAPAPRRRGRQPKDPSTLTEKQLRAREAQKRFRDKQKRMMAETEEAVNATSEELDRLRVAHESQRLKNEVLERLLQHKEAQVHALEFQKQMDPPPRFTVNAHMVDMMRREGIAGLFTPDVLLRYAVAGYTEHMDERGEVKEPPPFEKVAEDWRSMVEMVRGILEAARQGPAPPAEPGSDAAAAEAQRAAAAAQLHEAVSAEVNRGVRAARPAEVVEVHSGSSGSLGVQHGGAAAAGASSSAQQGSQGSAGETRQPADGRPPLDHATSVTGEALPSAEALAAQRAGAVAAAAGGGSGSGGSGIEPTVSQAGSGGASRPAAPVTKVPEDVLPEVAAIAEEAPDEVLEAAEAKDDPIARFVLARILSQTAAHSHLQWDTLVDGASVQDGDELYRFSGKQLRTLAHLMRRVGTMLWQQALLFPQHITKLGCLRLDDPNNLHAEAQDPEHWRGILRRLNCTPAQLQKIMAGHQRYMARMAPVLEERKEALAEVQRCTELQMQHAWSPDASSASFVANTNRLTLATGLVMETVSAQHAAYCELLIAIFYALTFPVQRPKMFVLSWPYFPQLQLIGRAAALELGFDIGGYPVYSGEVDG